MLTSCLRFIATLTIAVLIQALLVGAVHAQDREEEYRLKALLLSRLVSFVTWPDARAVAPLSLCIAGEDPFDGGLQAAFADYETVVHQFGSDYSGLDRCHLLFISDSEIRRLDEVLDLVANKPILTVSDVPRFASSGGMIYLTFDNRRVRFRINKEEADAVDVRLSFQLLSLADIVATTAREG